MGSSDSTKLTQAEIETKLKTSFTGITDSNITILAHYLYNNPKKWRSDENFTSDVNKLMSEAFAHSMKPSNVLFGAVLAILVLLLIGLFWWIIQLFIKKNNKNVLNDPSGPNPIFI